MVCIALNKPLFLDISGPSLCLYWPYTANPRNGVLHPGRDVQARLDYQLHPNLILAPVQSKMSANSSLASPDISSPPKLVRSPLRMEPSVTDAFSYADRLHALEFHRPDDAATAPEIWSREKGVAILDSAC